jgi:hypothetical protein
MDTKRLRELEALVDKGSKLLSRRYEVSLALDYAREKGPHNIPLLVGGGTIAIMMNLENNTAKDLFIRALHVEIGDIDRQFALLGEGLQ